MPFRWGLEPPPGPGEAAERPDGAAAGEPSPGWPEFGWQGEFTLATDPPRRVAFGFPEPAPFAAWPRAWPVGRLRELRFLLANFVAVSQYLGLGSVYAHLVPRLARRGHPPEAAWENLHLAWGIVLAELTGLQDRLGILLDAADPGRTELTYPLSPLHGWAVAESCRAYREVLEPELRRTAGVGGLFHDGPAALAAAAAWEELAGETHQLVEARVDPYGCVVPALPNLSVHEQIDPPHRSAAGSTRDGDGDLGR